VSQSDSKKVSCILLYSGGLDSILSYKVLEEQGIDVTAIRFISPFFGSHLLKKENQEKEIQDTKEKYGIKLVIKDVSDEFLDIVKNPKHGYGRYLNPCIDCKIFMIKKALTIMHATKADFIATGEIVGQRPMSQRRDALNIIDRESGAKGLILRPLCAKHLSITKPEEKGLINRERLLSICGRGRKDQIKLANLYGIRDYPAPAGGCILTDPIISERIKKLIELYDDFTAYDALLTQVGRQFLIEGNAWLIVGRNKGENARIKELTEDISLILKAESIPSPTAALFRFNSERQIEISARILARYCNLKKVQNSNDTSITVNISLQKNLIKKLKVTPLDIKEIEQLRL